MHASYSVRLLRLLGLLTIVQFGFTASAVPSVLLRPMFIRARCYANCLTEVMKAGPPDPGCNSSLCQQCISPCGKTFVTVQSCNAACPNSICQSSCQFLNAMQNWTDIENGLGSTIAPPSAPVVVTAGTSVSTLKLSWQPPANVSTGVVYLLMQRYAGDMRGGPFYLRTLVFTDRMALIILDDVCGFVSIVNRFRWNGLQFYFQVVALTKDSKLAMGPESSQILMPKPDPVPSIARKLFKYVARTIGDKLDVTVSVNPPTGASSALITGYAIVMPSQRCLNQPSSDILLSRHGSSRQGSTNVTLILYQKMKACNMSMRAYSVAQCIPSAPTTFYTFYQGCRFLEGFPRNDCLKIDPPPTSDADRAVRNLTNTPLQPAQDYRFSTNITWLPPVFPYSFEPFVYEYQLTVLTVFCFLGRCVLLPRVLIFTLTKNTHVEVKNMEPGKNYTFKINPQGKPRVWNGVNRQIDLLAPAVPVNLTIPQNTAANFDMTYLPATKFSVSITWDKPSFQYGIITSYSVIYKKGKDGEKTVTVNQKTAIIGGFDYNEPLVFKVKAVYKEGWISSVAKTTNDMSTQAPTPAADAITVNSLEAAGFVEIMKTNLYTANFTWTKPSLNKAVQHYVVSYTLSGYPDRTIICPSTVSTFKGCQPNTTKTAFYAIPGVRPRESITIRVTPVFSNAVYISGRTATLTTNAPNPRPQFLTPRNLSSKTDHAKGIIRISWESPLLGFSAVKYYKVRYVIKWMHHRFATERDSNAIENKVAVTYFDLPEIQLGSELLVKVTPVFVIPLLGGRTAGLTVKPFMDNFCTGRKAGYFADPFDCASYCYCDTNGGPLMMRCPPGLLWNEKRKGCDFPKYVTCPPGSLGWSKHP